MQQDDDPPSERFVSLLTQHQTHLLGYIRASLGSRGNAEDVLQQTNLALWRKASQFDAEADFLPWAITFARFEIMAFLRDNGRDRMLFDTDVVEMMTGVAAEQVAPIARRQEALRKCLKQLGNDQRAMLAQKYVQGMRIKDIGLHSDRSEDAVKSLLLRIRRQLSQCVKRSLMGLSS